jgi:hypothetical protein
LTYCHGERPADVRSWVIHSLSVPELLILATELVDAVATGDTEDTLARWAKED